MPRISFSGLASLTIASAILLSGHAKVLNILISQTNVSQSSYGYININKGVVSGE